MKQNAAINIKPWFNPSAWLLLNYSSLAHYSNFMETSKVLPLNIVKWRNKWLKIFCFWTMFIHSSWILYCFYEAQEVQKNKIIISPKINKIIISYPFPIIPKEKNKGPKLTDSEWYIRISTSTPLSMSGIPYFHLFLGLVIIYLFKI